jgi:hypothetical protein
MKKRISRRHPDSPAKHRRGDGPVKLKTNEHNIWQKNFDICVIVVLLLFGAYISWLYFGHQVVPNSDFPAFVRVARSLLAFEMPASFKRAPVLGLLQIALSRFVTGPHPLLTAGWLLNAILYPLSIVLLYLVAKRFIPKAAAWFALIAAINPWLLSMLVQPIAETTLIFFILLTFYMMLRRSKWCYFFAAVTTMVRYEGTVLILAAFVMDMIESESGRQRLIALLCSVLASIPLALWLLGTFIGISGTDAGTSGHYIAQYGHGTVFAKFAELLGRVSFTGLFRPTSQNMAGMLRLTITILASGMLLFGCAYGLYKKKWDILALLLFFVPYLLIHSLKSGTRDRYCTPIAWLVLLLACFGVQTVFEIVNRRFKVPATVVTIAHLIFSAFLALWAIELTGDISKISYLSTKSASVPYAALFAVIAVFVLAILTWRFRFFFAGLSLSVLLCLMIVSNQFMLVRIMGDGQNSAEFKKLADWYIANAGSGEKLLTTLPSTVGIFAPERQSNFVHTKWLKTDTPEEFVQACYKRNITYVAWDSRLGLTPQNSYYKKWGLKNMSNLAKPRNVGPFEFIHQIRRNDRWFINIFRLAGKQDESTP